MAGLILGRTAGLWLILLLLRDMAGLFRNLAALGLVFADSCGDGLVADMPKVTGLDATELVRVALDEAVSRVLIFGVLRACWQSSVSNTSTREVGALGSGRAEGGSAKSTRPESCRGRQAIDEAGLACDICAKSRSSSKDMSDAGVAGEFDAALEMTAFAELSCAKMRGD